MRSLTAKKWWQKKAAFTADTRHRRRLRERAVEEQGGRCIYCEEPFTEDRPATLEHIVPVAKGGADTSDNCAASCWPCNQARDQANHGAFMRYMRAQKERV